jgi:hypothetical protein
MLAQNVNSGWVVPQWPGSSTQLLVVLAHGTVKTWLDHKQWPSSSTFLANSRQIISGTLVLAQDLSVVVV